MILLGVDVNRLLAYNAYKTQKKVKIHDRTLCTLFLALNLGIVIYFIVIKMCYEGKHFLSSPIDGIWEMHIYHPTINPSGERCNPWLELDCDDNYSRLEDLPYCLPEGGAGAAIPGGRRGAAARHRCEYFDALEVITRTPQGLFLPSFVRAFEQRHACASQSCRRKWEFVSADGQPQARIRGGNASPTRERFVADLEAYVVLLDHSFMTEDRLMAFASSGLDGYVMDCRGTSHPLPAAARAPPLESPERCRWAPIPCVAGDCLGPGGRSAGEGGHGGRHIRDGSQPPFVRAGHGDATDMRTLLELAGVDLDSPLGSGPGEVEEPRSPRTEGLVLVIDIQYTNDRPWTLYSAMEVPPRYLITVTRRPTPEFKMSLVTGEQDDRRTFDTRHGVLLVVRQHGAMRVFDVVHTLVLFATVASMLKMAKVCTDQVATKVMARRQLYKAMTCEDHLPEELYSGDSTELLNLHKPL